MAEKEKFICYEDFYPEITDKGIKDLYKLIEIVYNKHFNYAPEHKEDLYSCGVVKALSIIRGGSFDSSKSSLKNFLYTGIRNDMKNYLYKLSRDIPVDEDIMAGANETEDMRAEDVIVLGKINLPRCKQMNKVLASLQYIGFNVGVKPENFPEVNRWLNIAIYQMIRGV